MDALSTPVKPGEEEPVQLGVEPPQTVGDDPKYKREKRLSEFDRWCANGGGTDCDPFVFDKIQSQKAKKRGLLTGEEKPSIPQSTCPAETPEACMDRQRRQNHTKRVADGVAATGDVIDVVVTPDATDVAAAVAGGVVGVAANKGRKIDKSLDAIKTANKAKKGIAISLKPKSGWTKSQVREFERKVASLNEAAKQGKLRKATPAQRGQATRQYRKELLERVGSRYSDDPKTLRKLEDQIEKMDVDHIIELQLDGLDKKANLKMLDSSVNRSVGIQIKNALDGLDEGTIINKIEIIE